jgi:hypothetical protein
VFPLSLAFALALGIVFPAASVDARPAADPPAAETAPVVRDQRAATFFFYWYDAATGLHTRNPNGSDSLTDHPADLYAPFFSYKDPLWIRQELLDMRAAGIDVVLPVFWGSDHERFWAMPGLQNIVAVEQFLLVQGLHPPRVGMFFDTSALAQQNAGMPLDLTTASGREVFYGMIADFFALVPAELRAEVGGRPIIYLYIAFFAKAYDQALFDFVERSFERDFGVRPFIVRESSWTGVATDGEYAWGTALLGPRVFGPSASLGPGFDNSAVALPSGRIIRDRECGEFYQDGWEAVIDSGAKQVAVETWNEFHEATDIAFSREYGRSYIDLTRENLDRWRAAPPPETGVVWVALGRSPKLHGLHPAANGGDGTWAASFMAGREAAAPVTGPPSPSQFIYLTVRDDFLYARVTEAYVTVEYLDSGTAGWWVEYDGAGGPYTRTAAVRPEGTGEWKTRTFRLPDAFFGGRENFDADLRLASAAGPGAPGVAFSRVWVSLAPLPASAPFLDGWADLTVLSGVNLGLPVTAVDAEGHPLRMSLDRGPSFCRLVDYGNGAGTLILSPSSGDVRPCPYRVRILVTDESEPSLEDAQTLYLTVAERPSPARSSSGRADGLAR